MRSILTVTTEATSYDLLTMDELRQATGIASGQTTELTALGKQVADAITSRCNLRAAGASRKTLRSESLSQVFRLDCPAETLILARRPVSAIASVTEDTATVTSTDYEIEPETGILRRLCSDYPAWWSACKITVAFTAGWDTVPHNLRNAAMKLTTSLFSSAGDDPNLRSLEIPGVVTKEWWVSEKDNPLFSAEIEDLLGDYINPGIA